MLRAVVVAALVAVSGCMTTKAPDRWSALPEQEKAVLFGAITADTSSRYTLSRYEISYRNVATGEVGAFGFSPVRSWMPELGSDRGDPELSVPRRSSGRIFEVTLPAGDYEFFQVHLVNVHGGLGSSTWKSKEPFSVPFTIEPGRTYYIGEIRGFPMIGTSLIGMSVPAGGYFIFVDREARDTELLAKRRGAALGPVVNIVPEIVREPTPFVRTTPLTPFTLLPEERGIPARPSASLTQ